VTAVLPGFKKRSIGKKEEGEHVKENG